MAYTVSQSDSFAIENIGKKVRQKVRGSIVSDATLASLDASDFGLDKIWAAEPFIDASNARLEVARSYDYESLYAIQGVTTAGVSSTFNIPAGTYTYEIEGEL